MCVRMNVRRAFLCASVAVFVLAGMANAVIIVPTIDSQSNTNPYSTATTANKPSCSRTRAMRPAAARLPKRSIIAFAVSSGLLDLTKTPVMLFLII